MLWLWETFEGHNLAKVPYFRDNSLRLKDVRTSIIATCMAHNTTRNLPLQTHSHTHTHVRTHTQLPGILDAM